MHHLQSTGGVRIWGARNRDEHADVFDASHCASEHVPTGETLLYSRELVGFDRLQMREGGLLPWQKFLLYELHHSVAVLLKIVKIR